MDRINGLKQYTAVPPCTSSRYIQLYSYKAVGIQPLALPLLGRTGRTGRTLSDLCFSLFLNSYMPNMVRSDPHRTLSRLTEARSALASACPQRY